jgi:crotonobetainyl-CoA:carnitine CoA-transferase CaiB-like acyl-CoA transferase
MTSATVTQRAALPLADVRVLDLADGKGEACGRMLADLGADVLRVEPPGGARSRSACPMYGGTSLYFATHNTNKHSVTIDLTSRPGRDRLLALAREADILIESEPPGQLAERGLGAEALHQANPWLVITSITDFGQNGPYRDWMATDWVHLALNSVLSRSGAPGEPPLMPPGHLAEETASVQAAWATLIAYWVARKTGRGEHIDVSVFEASLQTMDPAFGIAGSATGGVPASDLPPGRPDVRHMYPIFPCADGHVRICVLARRQWRGMFTWLGEPAEFAGQEYDLTGNRFAAAKTLYPLIGNLFWDKTRAELVAEGQRLGVPIESVQLPAEVLRNEHFLARGAIADMTLPDGRTGRVPHGLLELDGQRAGIREPAPEPGGHHEFQPRDARQRSLPDVPPMDGQDGALAGLRVLDLGVIVVGAETGRLFADQGADVLKIESRAFPDGSRQSLTGAPISASFAWGHRNKRSLGLDLRSAAGKDLFLELIRSSDVVLSNFKPGTLESLGLGYEVLRQSNPGIIVVDSSAMGRTGPASLRMGYGPLVRAATGLTSLWRYPGQPDGFCDSITVYPDHTAARVGAVGALARLISREHTGEGGTVSVAQAETMLIQFAADFLRESLEPGSMTTRGNIGEHDAPYGIYPCAGDDQWCAITIRNGTEWQQLCQVIDAPDLDADEALQTPAGRVAQRERIEARLTDWTAQHSPHEVMSLLQGKGVPAGAMQRVNELLRDPHLVERGFFTTLTQRQIGDIPAETGPARFSRIPGPPMRPAPLQGEHTRQIARELLTLDDAEIEKLCQDGILQDAQGS